MANNTIETIREAEINAEQSIKKAELEAEKIIADAKLKAEDIIKTTTNRCIENENSKKLEATKKAQNLSAEKLSDTEKEIALLRKNAMSKQDNVINKIKELII